MNRINLDEKDKIILKLISKNPRITQQQLAEALNISQPAISMRINKLKKLGLLELKIGINPLRSKMALARVDIKARDVKFLDDLIRCPYIIYAATTTGRFNVFLLLAAEDYRTLEAIINKHIRGLDGIEDLEFNMILDINGPFVVPFKSTDYQDELPECAIKLLESSGCKYCSYYEKNLCLGCPFLSDYRGSLLNSVSPIKIR